MTFDDFIGKFLPQKLKDRLEGPVYELTAHFLLSVLALVFIAISDLAMHLLGLSHRLVPLIRISLSDWMFDMDVLSVSVILLVGLAKALKEMW